MRPVVEPVSLVGGAAAGKAVKGKAKGMDCGVMGCGCSDRFEGWKC